MRLAFFILGVNIHLHRSPVTSVMGFKDKIIIKTNLLSNSNFVGPYLSYFQTLFQKILKSCEIFLCGL